MTEQARNTLQNNLTVVSDLVARYPYCIPVMAAAEVLHIKPEAL